jgi:hypothetical protein
MSCLLSSTISAQELSLWSNNHCEQRIQQGYCDGLHVTFQSVLIILTVVSLLPLLYAAHGGVSVDVTM